MGKQIRIQFPGALYHVYARGNNKNNLFLCSDDRITFLDILNDTAIKHNFICYSYCLMSNHYHLVLETCEDNLSSAIHRINCLYARKFNRKYHRVGHLFQGRYNAILIQRETYLLEVCRYVVLNPVRANIVNDPGEYRWSSYKYTVSLKMQSGFLKGIGKLLAFFDDDPNRARVEYAAFVRDGFSNRSPMDQVKNDIALGDEEFLESLNPRIGNSKNNEKENTNRMKLFCTDLGNLFNACDLTSKTERNKLIIKACKQLGYSQTEVSDYLGLNRKTIRRILNSDVSDKMSHN